MQKELKSKIEIQYPFTDKFDSAYRVESQGRRTIVLYSTVTKERTSISYAKYLMSIHLKRWLSAEEHVDHINNDKLDDRIENYQILSSAENNQKEAAKRGNTMVKYKCPICNAIFSLQKKYSHLQGRKTATVITCSRSCGGKTKHLGIKEIIYVGQYNWYDEHHWSEKPPKAAYIHDLNIQ